MFSTSVTSARVRNREDMTAVWHAVAPGPGCPQCSVRVGPQTAGWPSAAMHHEPGEPMDTSVMDLPAPVAARLRRPGWRDPRLLAGIAMVAASVLLGSWAVRTAQATVPVYVTRAALVPGDRVAAQDLAVVDVRLGTVNLEHYLRADEEIARDVVAVRAVG